MTSHVGALRFAHANLWHDDRSYRLCWYIWPQCAAIFFVGFMFFATSSFQPSNETDWAKPSTVQDVDKLLESLRDEARESKSAMERLEKLSSVRHAPLPTFYLATLYDPSNAKRSNIVPADAKRAVELYTFAAEKDLKTAQWNLARLLYLREFGVQDRVTGCLWIKKLGQPEELKFLTPESLADLKRARQSCDQGVPSNASQTPSSPPEPANLQIGEAEALNKQVIELYRARKYLEAIPFSQRALVIVEKALGPNHLDVAAALRNLGKLYYAQRRYAEAEPLFKRALSIREQALGSKHPDVADVLEELGALYDDIGRYAEAEPLLKRALSIREQAFGQNHSDVAQSLNNLASLYYRLGRYAQAEPLLKRALSIREQAFGQNHPDVAQSINNLALLYDKLGRYAEAERLRKRASTMPK